MPGAGRRSFVGDDESSSRAGNSDVSPSRDTQSVAGRKRPEKGARMLKKMNVHGYALVSLALSHARDGGPEVFAKETRVIDHK